MNPLKKIKIYGRDRLSLAFKTLLIQMIVSGLLIAILLLTSGCDGEATPEVNPFYREPIVSLSTMIRRLGIRYF